MATERQREAILGVLLVTLAIAGYRAWSTISSEPSPAVAGAPSGVPGGRPGAVASGSNFDVHLDALNAGRPEPAAAERNLFRFRPKAPPPRLVNPQAPPPPVARGPVGPPPPPPITLKFIGIVEAPQQAQKIAILSDGSGVSLYGKEGDVLAGQYRILKIGVESIDMSYLDGRGRQTIRLSGS